MSGNTALIQAQDGDYPHGSAYVFRFTGTSWVQEAKLRASDGTDRGGFQGSVSVSGDTAVLGGVEDRWSLSSRFAYVFRFDGTSWVPKPKLVAQDGTLVDGFGVSVALSGDTALVGVTSRTA